MTESYQDFLSAQYGKEKVKFNLAALTNLRIHNILDTIRKCKLSNDFLTRYLELMNLYSEIRTKIVKKEQREEEEKHREKLYKAHETYYKKVNTFQHNVSVGFVSENQGVNIPREVEQSFLQYEWFLRKVMEDRGMLIPMAEDER